MLHVKCHVSHVLCQVSLTLQKNIKTHPYVKKRYKPTTHSGELLFAHHEKRFKLNACVYSPENVALIVHLKRSGCKNVSLKSYKYFLACKLKKNLFFFVG